MPLTESQLSALETTERIASCFSVVGTIFIFVTFISSSKFRRPINRLVFYASWGNTISNIATLMSRSPIGYGAHSHICQFQGFLIQMFVPADAFWNLAMAFNVYLTLFRNYNASQLKSLEWRYLVLCYGTPFIIAFTLLFPSTPARGKIYGDAILWCWIDPDWEFLRIAVCYAPSWCCILASMTIYVWAGRKIFAKRQQLRVFRNQAGGYTGGAGHGRGNALARTSYHGSTTYSSSDDSAVVNDSISKDPDNYKTTNIEITSTIVPLENVTDVVPPSMDVMASQYSHGVYGAGIGNQGAMGGKVYKQYSVDIGAAPMGTPRIVPPLGTIKTGLALGGTDEQARARKNRAAMEANRAAWGYTKVALLFFISLLVTWVPSSVNRVYALAHPHVSNPPLAFAAGIVLSLMGFWNSVIYIATSRAACKELFCSIIAYLRPDRGFAGPGEAKQGRDWWRINRRDGRIGTHEVKSGQEITLGRRSSIMKPRLVWGDDWERLQASGGQREMGTEEV